MGVQEQVMVEKRGTCHEVGDKLGRTLRDDKGYADMAGRCFCSTTDDRFQVGVIFVD